MTVLPDDGLSLAAEFPDATLEQWQRLVAGVLRKAGKDVQFDQVKLFVTEVQAERLREALQARALQSEASTKAR